MTTIPDLGPWGTLSDIIEGGINEALGKAEEALSRSGTSVAGIVSTSADLPASPRDGEAVIVQDTTSMYVWSDARVEWVGPVPVQGAATEAAIANAVTKPTVLNALTRTGKRPVGQGEVVINAADHPSIQAAITAAEAIGSPAVVQVRGNHALTSALTLARGGVRLDLADATLSAGGSWPAVINVTGAPDAKITGGKINAAGTALTGIRFTDSPGATAQNVQAYNTAVVGGGSGIGFLRCDRASVVGGTISNVTNGVAFEDSEDASADRVIVLDARHDGILFYNGSHRGTATSIVVRGFNLGSADGRSGIHAYGSSGVRVYGSHVAAGAGTYGKSDSPSIRFRDAPDFTCTGNTVDGSGRIPGIGVHVLSDMGLGSGNGAISGNTVLNSGTAGIFAQLGGGATASDMQPLAITGNYVRAVRTGTGILAVAAVGAVAISGGVVFDVDGDGINTAAPFATVNGVMVRRAGQGASGPRAGIFVTAGLAVVSGCIVTDDQTTPKMINALRVLSGATVVEGANHYAGVAAGQEPVRNDGILRSQMGGYTTAQVGFYGKAPVARPTLTADPTPAQIRAALAALGLIA